MGSRCVWRCTRGREVRGRSATGQSHQCSPKGELTGRPKSCAQEQHSREARRGGEGDRGPEKPAGGGGAAVTGARASRRGSRGEGRNRGSRAAEARRGPRARDERRQGAPGPRTSDPCHAGARSRSLVPGCPRRAQRRPNGAGRGRRGCPSSLHPWQRRPDERQLQVGARVNGMCNQMSTQTRGPEFAVRVGARVASQALLTPPNISLAARGPSSRVSRGS